jgi:hypothetical protein
MSDEQGKNFIMNAPSSEKILSAMLGIPRSPDEHLYAIVDAAQDQRIYPMLKQAGRTSFCLYLPKIHFPADIISPELATAVPYLLQVEQNDMLIKELLSEGWGNHWLIFLICALPAEFVHRHCSNCILAQDTEGNRFHFRYYDPRVMHAYLPECNGQELELIFGPVARFFLEDEETDSLMTYSREKNKLVVERIPVGDPAEIS